MTRRRGRAPAGAAPFFDHFRAALARLPAGLIGGAAGRRRRPGARRSGAGPPLPPPYAAFLHSFDGADLFHETILIAGVGPRPRCACWMSPSRRRRDAAGLRDRRGGRAVRAGRRRTGRPAGRRLRRAGCGRQRVRGLAGRDGRRAPGALRARRRIRAGRLRPVGRGGHTPDRAPPGRAGAEAGSGRGGLGARRGAGADSPWPLHAPRSRRSSARWRWTPTIPGSGSIWGARRWRPAAGARGGGVSESGRARAWPRRRHAARVGGPRPGGQAPATEARALAEAALDGTPTCRGAGSRDRERGRRRGRRRRAEATALLAAVDPGAMPPVRVRLRVVDATEPALRKPPPDRPPRPTRAGPPRSGGRRPGR